MADDRTIHETGSIRIKRCRHGWMAYNIHDLYIGRSMDLYGESSEAEMGLLGQLVEAGSTVLDIGANIGDHTLAFAEMIGPRGRVIALEPQRHVFHTLCTNISLNDLRNVHAIHAAAGRELGSIPVPPLDYSATNNFGGLSLHESLPGEPVSLISIDSLTLDACRLIKIDVEGMEGEVLAGATETIHRLRPVLYVENDRRDRSAALIQQLFDLDYRLYWHLPRLFNPNNFFGRQENVFGSVLSSNMLALPRATKQTVSGLHEIKSAEASLKFVQR